ncbi:MAG: hypothetical protein ABII75_09880 [Candidatus Omnitrophota bacterium]
MAKHRKASFKIEKFIVAAKDVLLKQYFEERKISVPDKFEFKRGKEFDDFWEGISEVRRKKFEEELHLVDDIAESTRDYIQDAITDFNITTEKDDAGNDENGETLALRIFLHKDKNAFQQVYDKYSCMTYLKSVSKCKFKSGKVDLSDKSIEAFVEEIKNYYGTDGKGKHCKVRKYDEDDRFFMLIARGEYIKTGRVFDENGDIIIESSRPVEEDFVYLNKKTLVFRLQVGGQGRKDKPKAKYLEAFGKQVLGLKEINDDTVDHNIVDLTPIKEQKFSYEGNDRIEKIKLTHVNETQTGLSIRISGGDINPFFQRFKLGADGTVINGVKLKFWLRREGKDSESVTIEIKPPEITKIPKDELKEVIEAYLYEQKVLLDR